MVWFCTLYWHIAKIRDLSKDEQKESTVFEETHRDIEAAEKLWSRSSGQHTS